MEHIDNNLEFEAVDNNLFDNEIIDNNLFNDELEFDEEPLFPDGVNIIHLIKK